MNQDLCTCGHDKSWHLLDWCAYVVERDTFCDCLAFQPATTPVTVPPSRGMIADTNILDPRTGEVIAFAGEALDDEKLYRLEMMGVENQPVFYRDCRIVPSTRSHIAAVQVGNDVYGWVTLFLVHGRATRATWDELVARAQRMIDARLDPPAHTTDTFKIAAGVIVQQALDGHISPEEAERRVERARQMVEVLS